MDDVGNVLQTNDAPLQQFPDFEGDVPHEGHHPKHGEATSTGAALPGSGRAGVDDILVHGL